MKLGENIFNLRKNLKLSQEKLAEKIGVTRQTISNWELGETSPNPEQLKLLSKTLKVSVDELLENDTRDLLVEKISNTEKLAGLILNILKGFGIFLLIYFLVLLILSAVVTILGFDKELDKTNVSFTCKMNDEEYNYFVEYDDNDKILSHGGSSFISDILKNEKFESGTLMIKYIENYFKDNGGNC